MYIIYENKVILYIPFLLLFFHLLPWYKKESFIYILKEIAILLMPLV